MIINLIENHNVTTFYNGGKGDFDWLCAYIVDELKKDYPFISSHFVLAHKYKYANNLKIFDTTIYPEMEKIPPRFAIIKRDQWIVDNAKFLIAYVKQSLSSGAYKTFCYVQKKNMTIISICI